MPRNIKINAWYYPELIVPQKAVIIINVPVLNHSSASSEFVDYQLPNNTSFEYADSQLISDYVDYADYQPISNLTEYADYHMISNSSEYADYQLISETIDGNNSYMLSIKRILSDIGLIDDRQESDDPFDLQTNDTFAVTNQSLFTDDSFFASNQTKEAFKSQSVSSSFLQIFFILFSSAILMYVVSFIICFIIVKKFACRQPRGRVEEHIEMVDLF
jgi:hypothetical protein